MKIMFTRPGAGEAPARPSTHGGAALVMVLASSVLFGVTPALVKEVTALGMGALSATMYRMLFISLLAVLGAKGRGADFGLNRRQAVQIVLFGVAGYGATCLLLAYSYNFISMGTATMCHFTYPVLVLLAMGALYREPCRGLKRLAIPCAMCGVAALGAAGGGGEPAGILLAVLSGVAYGAYVIAMERSAFSTLDRFVFIAYCTGASALFFLCCAAGSRSLQWSLPLRGWAYLFLAALADTAAVALLCGGVRMLGASTASFINMAEPVTSLVIDFVVYATVPSPLGWAGCAMLLASILLVSLQSMREERGSTEVEAVAHNDPSTP